MRGRDLDPAELAALLGDRHPPTPEQAAVVASPLQPLLVVAGAGSGKTSTMAARVVWLVVTGRARPEQVLGLTFTRKAAGELAEKVRGRLAAAARAGLLAHLEPEEVALPAAPAPPGLDAPVVLPGEPVVSTYHAYAGRLYREHAVRLGLEPGARLITPAVAFQLMSSVVAARDEPLDAVGLTPPSVVAGALALAGELAEHLAEPRAVRDAGRLLREQADGLGLPTLPAPTRKALACQAAREQLLELVEAYERAKRTRDLVDHGDVVALAARAARASAAVGEVERARAGVVLLDEYQDTGHAQRVLLTTLFGRGHPVTAVGDPSQSIYGWRGASAGGLARFPRDFPLRDGSPAPRLTLATSHRNDGAVLRAANHLARPLAEVTPDVPVLRPAAGREADGRVTAALLETEAEEAAWVAEQVWQALGGAVARSDSAAVLVRRRAQVPALREALVGRGLPVEVVGLGGLLTVPEVADVVAVLRAVADPGANPSVVRLLTGPRCRLGPRDLAALGRRARDLARSRGGGEVGPAPHAAPDAVERAVLAAEDPDGTGSLVEAVADPGPAGPDGLSPVGLARVQELAAVLARVREQAARPLPDLVALVERLWGVDLEVAARPGTRDAGAARVELDAFADVAAEFAGDAERPTLDAFVAYLEAAEDEERGLETGGGRVSPDASVKVLTVHAAKGLEWDVVAVPGLATGSLAAAAVFPASPRVSPAWTRNRALLPFALRGDAEDLPVLAACDGAGLQGLEEAVRARALLEERRLAYVALTRARHVALVSGRWWGEGKSRLGPSLFLREMVRSGPPAGPGGPAGEAAEAAGAAAGARAAADVDVWCPEPDEGAENPTLGRDRSVPWPAPRDADGLLLDAAGRPSAAHRALVAAAARVRAAAVPDDGAAGQPSEHPADRPEEPTDPRVAARLARWDEEVEVLLAEREERRQRAQVPEEVPLPATLTVSDLVALGRDPDALARRLRRPLPRPPGAGARRGTGFHAWLEGVWGQQVLLGPEDVPGGDVEDRRPDATEDVAALQEAFRRTRWWGRAPHAVEVALETRLAGHLLRGRVDAVFADPDGGWTVVDWKTGPPPEAAALRVAAVQLAAYRVAWAELQDVPLEQVRAAFHHVAPDVTLTPVDLLDRAGLEALVEAATEDPAGQA